MARVIDAAIERQQPAPAKYPWDQWADGRVWRLDYGVDYHTKWHDSMVSNARRYAHRHGLRLVWQYIWQDPGNRGGVVAIVLQFLPAEDTDERHR
jgi:hypothetical protein